MLSRLDALACAQAARRATYAALALPLLVLGCGPTTPTETDTPDPAVATTLTLSQVSLTLDEGETVTLIATVSDQNGATMAGATVSWTSSDVAVATVSSDGAVTGVDGDGAATLTATSGAASATATVTVVDGPGPFTIDASANIASVAVGESITIEIYAIDADTGEEVPFTATSAGACVDAAVVGTAVDVTGVEADCQQEIVVTAEQETKTIVIEGFDPSYLDIGGGLQIKYTNDFAWRWNDDNTSGDHDVTWWHPTPPAGWYALGSYVEIGYANINSEARVPMVIVRDESMNGDKLAAPDSFRVLWTDANSNGTYDGSMWKPICPSGFVALGSVAQAGGAPPPTDSVRCVAEAHTIEGTVGPWVWDDGGTGATFGDLAVHRVGLPAFNDGPDGEAAVPTRAMVACTGSFGGGGVCQPSDFHLLRVPLGIVASTDDGREPRLNAQGTLQFTGSKFSSSVRVPFTMIPSEDPTCGTAACAAAASHVNDNVDYSPFYYLERIETYQILGLPFDCTNCTAPTTIARTVEQCWSQTEQQSFTESIGLELSVGGEASFLGTGGSYSVTMSTELSWTTTTATTFGQCTTDAIEASVAVGHVGALVNVSNEFRARPADGAPNSLPSPTASFSASAGLVKYVRWPLN